MSVDCVNASIPILSVVQLFHHYLIQSESIATIQLYRRGLYGTSVREKW